jgi:hypothetical protein
MAVILIERVELNRQRVVRQYSATNAAAVCRVFPANQSETPTKLERNVFEVNNM